MRRRDCERRLANQMAELAFYVKKENNVITEM